MTSLILANALCILLVGGLRFGPSAVLVGAPAALWIPLMAVLAGSLLVALRREVARHQAPWQCRTRILLWLIFPGAAALNWSVGSQRQIAGADLPALALLLGLVIAVLARRWPEWGGRELSRAGWGIAARWVLLPTLAVVIWGLTRGAADGDTPISLATYPIFALAQLAAALVLPWTQWARDGVSSGRRVTGSTLLFALAHWPNPFAIMVTAAGMFVWGMAWRRGSALLPLALSMGLTATVITQTLPDDLTAHMRVGASYALKEEQFARSRSLDEETRQIQEQAAWKGEEDLAAWIGRVVALVTGDAPAPEFADATAQQLRRMHREFTLRWIFDSREFRRRHEGAPDLEISELHFFESPFVPFHDAHAPYTSLIDEGDALSHDEFIELAYIRLHGRSRGEREYGYWAAPLPPRTRAAFIRRLLEGHEHGDALRYWNSRERGALIKERGAMSRSDSPDHQ